MNTGNNVGGGGGRQIWINEDKERVTVLKLWVRIDEQPLRNSPCVQRKGGTKIGKLPSPTR